MKKIILTLLVISATVLSCQPEEDKTVTVEDKFSIVIPYRLLETDGLNENATLQYEHAGKDFVLMVFEEEKEKAHEALNAASIVLGEKKIPENIDGYTNLLMQNYRETFSISEEIEITDSLINDMPAKVASFTGKSDDEELYFLIGFIEGAQMYYRIVNFTLTSKEQDYKEKMKNIIYSIKEL